MDGAELSGCPIALVSEETWEVLAYASDWELGHTPVTTGRAPWLPAPFVQAMRAVREERGAARRGD